MAAEVVLTTWLFGLASGMRHAFEPDHMAAVSTVVAEGHGSRHSAWLGLWWGIGHTISLLVMGVLFGILRTELPAAAAAVFECAVGLMLIALGLRAIRSSYSRAAHVVRIQFSGTSRWTQSLVIGLLHGIAGSGALVAVAMTTIDEVSGQLVYVALFGLGSIAAMAAVSSVAGWQLSRLPATHRARPGILLAAGVLSVIVGLMWMYPLMIRLI